MKKNPECVFSTAPGPSMRVLWVRAFSRLPDPSRPILFRLPPLSSFRQRLLAMGPGCDHAKRDTQPDLAPEPLCDHAKRDTQPGNPAPSAATRAPLAVA